MRGLPSDCVECPTKKRKREGEVVVQMEMEIHDDEGVDRSADSVEKSFYSAHDSEAEVEVEEEDSVGEGSNNRWAGS